MNNIFQFINQSYGWLDKVYKDQFHLFSIFEQQIGLIPISISLHCNLSPFGFFIGVNNIECPIWEEKETKNCLEGLSHVLYCLLPSILNLHNFYDPIGLWMEEVCNSQSHP